MTTGMAGGVDLLEVGDERLLAEVSRFLLQHLAVADDGVERCPELVRHARQELGLVPVRHVELPEEARVLDGQRGLGGERLEQAHHLRFKAARHRPQDDEAAQHAPFPQERHGQEPAISGAEQ
jgi:hypothetical protein